MVQHLIVGLIEGIITPGAPRFLPTSNTTFWEDIVFSMLGHLHPAMWTPERKDRSQQVWHYSQPG